MNKPKVDHLSKRVKDKVVIITGGGSGIGRATSLLLAQHGAKVIVSDIDIEAAEETVGQLRAFTDETMCLEQDVANHEHWDKLLELVLSRYGHLDVLVNNAGIGISGECRHTRLEDWQRVIDINLTGTFLGVQAAINAIGDRISPNQSSASIINISSTYGLVGGGLVSYSAAKGGVTLLTKSAAAECARLGYNIRINSLHPGGVNTAMANIDSEDPDDQTALQEFYARVPMGRCAEPIEIAQGILFLASDESSYMTGSELVIDGGYTAV